MRQGSTLQGSGRLGAASPAPGEPLWSRTLTGEHQPSAPSPQPAAVKPGHVSNPGTRLTQTSGDSAPKGFCFCLSWCFGSSSSHHLAKTGGKRGLQGLSMQPDPSSQGLYPTAWGLKCFFTSTPSHPTAFAFLPCAQKGLTTAKNTEKASKLRSREGGEARRPPA